jgi:DNA-binding MarR family transcriptional regulator
MTNLTGEQKSYLRNAILRVLHNAGKAAVSRERIADFVTDAGFEKSSYDFEAEIDVLRFAGLVERTRNALTETKVQYRMTTEGHAFCEQEGL